MKILIVEDDHLQADWIRTTLESGLEGANVEHIRTEHDFQQHFDEIASDPPNVVVMDVMLRWSDPAPEIPAPPDNVRTEGFYRAGLRCSRLLARNERTTRIPVILFTVLEHSDLEDELQKLGRNIIYLRKEADADQLVAAVRSRLPQHPRL
jgi:DNA-binding NarL/FixJ family response regulator